MKDNVIVEAKVKALQETEPQRQFTLEELAEFDGKNGRPAYVAVNGIVYDVTPKAAWANGEHFGGVVAGKDNTVQYESCHAAFAILRRLEVVGVLVNDSRF